MLIPSSIIVGKNTKKACRKLKILFLLKTEKQGKKYHPKNTQDINKKPLKNLKKNYMNGNVKGMTSEDTPEEKICIHQEYA